MGALVAAATLLFSANPRLDESHRVIPQFQYRDMTTQYLFDDITFDEGFKLKPYRDSRNIWSIGIGHNIKADPTMNAQLQHLMTSGISVDQARVIFLNDVKTAEIALDLHIPWWRKLDDVRQDVLLNLCFNVGCAELLTWHHTLGYLQAGDYAMAGHELGSTQPWKSQVKSRADRLSKQLSTGVRQYPDPAKSQFALAS